MWLQEGERRGRESGWGWEGAKQVAMDKVLRNCIHSYKRPTFKNYIPGSSQGVNRWPLLHWPIFGAYSYFLLLANLALLGFFNWFNLALLHSAS